MNEKLGVDDRMVASAVMGEGMVEEVSAPVITYDMECFDKDGNLKWVERVRNTVMTGGKNDLLDKYFAGSSYTATWYVGLIDNASYSAIAAADVMNSHAGWIEGVPYSNANRLAPTWSSASAGSKAASTYVEFTINATLTVKGAFLTSNSTKSGTTGILYSASAFGANRSVVSGDFLRVTPTMAVA